MTKRSPKKGRRFAAFLSSFFALFTLFCPARVLPEEPITLCVMDAGCSREDVLTVDLTASDPSASADTAHGDAICALLRAYAPEARIVMLRCFTSALDTPGGLLPAGVKQATELGADILIMPWATVDADPALLSALNEASAAGVTLIAPVGNVGLVGLPTEKMYPASWPDVIAVGGVDPGPEGIPVSNILYRASDRMAVCALATGPDGEARDQSGTSFAAARVAGICGSLLGEDRALTPADLLDRLIASASDLGPAGFDPVYGWGFVQ